MAATKWAKSKTIRPGCKFSDELKNNAIRYAQHVYGGQTAYEAFSIAYEVRGLSQSAISRELRVAGDVISEIMREAGIPLRPKRDAIQRGFAAYAERAARGEVRK